MMHRLAVAAEHTRPSLDEQALREFWQARQGVSLRVENLPRVSVVMPAYRHGRFIERSILSVLNQNYPNLELIVIDGGSTDETLEILRRYGDELTWTSEPDRGQSDALNKGFARATGDIFAWLNSDDLFLPGAIDTAVNQFRSNRGASVVFGDWWSVNVNDRVIDKHPAFDFSLRHFIYEGFTHNSQAMFWTRSAHRRFGAFDIELHNTMDYDLIVRLGLSEGDERFVRVDAPLACFRRHADQKTQRVRVDPRVLSEHKRIAERLGLKKFSGTAKAIRLFYRARRALWYTRRNGLVYCADKMRQAFIKK